MSNRIFLINVGVNASHSAQSPIFPDGRFEFLPIPEEREWWSPPLPTYAKLDCFNQPGEPLTRYTTDRHRGIHVHNDPEFETFTYGDNCAESPRAAALAQVEQGDYLLFLARLVDHVNGKFTKNAGFYFIGYIRVENILRNVRAFPFGSDFTIFGANAHIRRAIYHKKTLNGFCVFKGDASSRRFEYAVPLDKVTANRLFRDARGQPWRWDTRRSDLQTIGSYTRSCRCVLDPSNADESERSLMLWEHIRANTPKA